MPLFEFDRKIPIQEIIDDSTLGSTRAKGRSLYARLTELPPEERQKEIDDLVSALRKQARQKSGIVVDLDTLETPETLETVISWTLLLMGGFSLPPLTGTWCLGKQATEKLRRRSPQIDQMIAQLENAFDGGGGNQELDFLSRINRVATFRRERV